MFHHLIAVALCLTSAAAGQDGSDQFPRGVSSGAFVVRAVHKDGVTVQSDVDFTSRRKTAKFNVAKETQIELADVVLEDGKPTVHTRRIALADLHPDQPINIIFFSDGKEL